MDLLELKKQLREKYKELNELPFPKLGYSVPQFALYDSNVAGIISSYFRNKPISINEIPLMDSSMKEGIEKYLYNNNDADVEQLRHYIESIFNILDILEQCIKFNQ